MAADAEVATFALAADLPPCSSSRLGEVYYVSSTKTFYYCDGQRQRVLEVIGEPGADGISFLVALSSLHQARTEYT
jgi:hypothetical protein